MNDLMSQDIILLTTIIFECYFQVMNYLLRINVSNEFIYFRLGQCEYRTNRVKLFQ